MFVYSADMEMVHMELGLVQDTNVKGYSGLFHEEQKAWCHAPHTQLTFDSNPGHWRVSGYSIHRPL